MGAAVHVYSIGSDVAVGPEYHERLGRYILVTRGAPPLDSVLDRSRARGSCGKCDGDGRSLRDIPLSPLHVPPALRRCRAPAWLLRGVRMCLGRKTGELCLYTGFSSACAMLRPLHCADAGIRGSQPGGNIRDSFARTGQAWAVLDLV